MFSESIPGFMGAYEKVIDLPDATNGLYIVQIKQNGKVINKKVVIQR